MSVQNQDEGTRTAFAVLIPLIVLIVGFVVGLGVHKARKPTAPVAAVAAVESTEADEARVVVENGVVTFFFASGKADLAADAQAALADVVQAVAAGKVLAISGFHDATGSIEVNVELAKQRAMAVRDVLKAMGVDEGRMALSKPEQMMGTGSNAQARRVEVVAQ
jgi:outer membrane protein OmpA-like peptidoglycan-associated protein